MISHSKQRPSQKNSTLTHCSRLMAEMADSSSPCNPRVAQERTLEEGPLSQTRMSLTILQLTNLQAGDRN